MKAGAAGIAGELGKASQQLSGGAEGDVGIDQQLGQQGQEQERGAQKGGKDGKQGKEGGGRK